MQITEMMKALSHETRLRVLHLLTEQGGLCVCDLYEVLETPQPTVSRHLKLLRDAGLVIDYRENQWVHYKIHPDLVKDKRVLIDKVMQLATQEHVFQNDLNRLTKVALAVCC